MTQAQIDSAVTARTAEQEARIQRNNDSLINATAKMKADSMMMNAGMQKEGEKTMTTAGRRVENSTNTRSVQHSSSGRTTTANTKTETNAPNSTITKEQQKEQKNKFNER